MEHFKDGFFLNTASLFSCSLQDYSGHHPKSPCTGLSQNKTYWNFASDVFWQTVYCWFAFFITQVLKGLEVAKAISIAENYLLSGNSYMLLP